MTENTTNASEMEDAERVILAGDHADDDHAVLDSLVEQQPDPPARVDLPYADLVPLRSPRAATRLLTGTSRMHSESGPVLLLPEDPDRKSLTIRVGASTEAYLRISDDPGKVATDMGSLLAYGGDSWVGVLGDHTGPVWAQVVRVVDGALTPDVTLTVSTVAVTK